MRRSFIRSTAAGSFAFLACIVLPALPLSPAVAQSMDGKWSGTLQLQSGSGPNCRPWTVELSVNGTTIEGRAFSGSQMSLINGKVEGPTMVEVNLPNWNYTNVQGEVDGSQIIFNIKGRTCSMAGTVKKAS